MKITLRQLKLLGACTSQVELFKEIFGTEVILTEEIVKKHGAKFDITWLANKMLTDEKFDDYEAKRNTLDDDYDAKCKPPYDDYYAKRNTLDDRGQVLLRHPAVHAHARERHRGDEKSRGDRSGGINQKDAREHDAV